MKKLILALTLSIATLPATAANIDSTLVAHSEVQASLTQDDIKAIQSCSDRHIHAAQSAITELEATLASEYNASIDHGRATIARIYHSQTADYLIPTALAPKLDLADKLSDLHCPQAREMYRDVMRNYTGSAYAAYRQRAEVGLTGTH